MLNLSRLIDLLSSEECGTPLNPMKERALELYAYMESTLWLADIDFEKAFRNEDDFSCLREYIWTYKEIEDLGIVDILGVLHNIPRRKNNLNFF